MSQSLNLYTLFARSKDRFAKRPCVLDKNGELFWRYEDLFTEADRFAATLIELGLERGDRVLVQVEKSPQLLAFYLACLKNGLTYVPINTAYVITEVEYFLEDARPSLFLHQDEQRFTRLPNQTQAFAWHTFLTRVSTTHITDNAALALDHNDIAAILYTSGTTGRPKGAMLTQGNLLSNVATLTEAWGWQQTDTLLHALPIFHAHGLFVGVHLALANGSPMIFLSRFDTENVVANLTRCTVFMGVPTFYTRLLERAELTQPFCSHVRLFISGSAPLNVETFQEFERVTGHRIIERYGMTETLMVTSNPLNGERIPGTIGNALPGIDVRLAQESPGCEDAAAELLVRGPNVFAGYWQRPELSTQEFTEDGYFKTGDLATMDAGGRVTLVGRAKELIISGGYNIYPREVENSLNSMAAIAESAVIGVPHDDFGESVVAFVVTTGPINEQDIYAALAGKLARYKQPKVIKEVEALPRNAMGKVVKRELREAYLSQLS